MAATPVYDTKRSVTDKWEKFFQVEPSTLSWHNIEVSSTPTNIWGQVTGPEVKIIKNVSGSIKPGTTVAIMGASGAGKTTLLNVLTGRNLSHFNVDGVVKINGRVADVKTMKDLTAYVQQEDLFIPNLTVREHLIFQSLLRMDSSLPMDLKVKQINFVMSELSLFKCADTRIGGGRTFKGISGGESKRLAFATEILTNPSIMFCDEPTSGLDAFMAHQLIGIVKKLARKGRTIVCTIHQPSTDTFELFDQLILMADGRIAYMGPLKSVIDYFNNLGFRCPNNYNPADYLIKEMAVVPGKEYECKNKITVICDYYASKNPPEHLGALSSFIRGQERNEVRSGAIQQYQALIWRAWLTTLREPILTYVRLSQAVTISIILGLSFLNTKYNSIGIFNLNAALFLIVNNMSYQNSMAVIDTFCLEFPTFTREHNNGMYTVLAYFIGKNTAEFPIFVAIPIVWISIYYYMVGLYAPFATFTLAVIVGILVSSISVSFGYFMSCLCSKTDIALAFSAPIMAPLQLWGGFFLNSKSVPEYFKYARTISWFYYAFKLLVYNQWEKVKKMDDLPNGTCQGHEPSEPCFETGQQVINFLDFKDPSTFYDLSALLLITIFFRTLSYYILWIRIKFTR